MNTEKEKMTEERKRREELDYTLVENDRCIYDSIDGEKVFSLLILQYENGVCTDYSFLYDISRDEERAKEILSLMKDNGVMPINSVDVLKDCL